MIPRKNEHILTIMTTFIKAKLNKADGQMIIDKYRVAAHTILHNIISGKEFDVFRPSGNDIELLRFLHCT